MNATKSLAQKLSTRTFEMVDTDYRMFEINMLWCGCDDSRTIDEAYDRFKEFHLLTELERGEACTSVTLNILKGGSFLVTIASLDPEDAVRPTHNGRFWA